MRYRRPLCSADTFTNDADGPSSSEAKPPHNARLLWDPPLLLRPCAAGGILCCCAVGLPGHRLAALGTLGPFAGARSQNRLPPKGSGARVQVMITVAYPYPLARRDMPRQQAGADCGLVRTRRS